MKHTSILVLLILFSSCGQGGKTSSPSAVSGTTSSSTHIQDLTTWTPTPASNVFIYRLNANVDSISVASVDLASGSLLEHEEFLLGSGRRPLDAVADLGRTHLYVAQSGTATIGQYLIDHPTGRLSFVRDLATYPGPSKLAIHPTGKFLYTLHESNSQVSVHAIDPVTGALTWLSAVTVSGPGARALTLDPTGAYLFASSDSYVRSFTVNPMTGALTYSGYQSPQYYNALAVNPVSRRLYAVSGMYGQFWGYDVNINGTLLSSSSSSGHHGFPYTIMDFSGDRETAYATNHFRSTLDSYAVSTNGYLNFANGLALPSGCSPKALHLDRPRSFIFTACSDTSGKTFSAKVHPDGSLASTGTSSTIPGATVSAIVVLEL